MNIKKTPRVEILPSPAVRSRALTGVDKEELDRLVEIQVAEIMAERDALAFEPFFRSRQVAYELKRLQNVPEQRKFSIAYERYGCMDCESRNLPHAGNCLCRNCHAKWFNRFAQIIAEGVEERPAKPAHRASSSERRLPEVQRASVHHTWLRPRASTRKALLDRVPKEESRAKVAKELIAAAEVAKNSGERALLKLLSENVIQRTGDGRNGNPFRYWKAGK